MNKGFTKRKAFELLAPYLLVSGSIYFFHRQAFKANIMSSVVLGTVSLVARQLSPILIKGFNPEEIAFGQADWVKYIGDIGDVPPIPEGMAEILNAPCPFHFWKRVGDTHMLVLIPQQVNGQPFTLNLLNGLKPKVKTAMHFSIYSQQVNHELGSVPTEKSYWVLMTKDVIPSSRNKRYEDQQRRVQRKDGYELPRAIEAAASIIMHYYKTDEMLYQGHTKRTRTNPYLTTFTRCQETVTKDNWPVRIGGFNPKGLLVTDCPYPVTPFDDGKGVAAVRRF